jgi:hypothetical protein
MVTDLAQTRPGRRMLDSSLPAFECEQWYLRQRPQCPSVERPNM